MNNKVDYIKNPSISNSVTISAQLSPGPTIRFTPAHDLFLDAINQEHRLATLKAGEAIQHAIHCGELLLQKKATLPHGEWLPWLNAAIESGQLHVKTRQANTYMKIAANPQRAADLTAPSIRAALELLTPAAPVPEPAPAPEPKRPWWEKQSAERNAQTCRMWPDIRHAAVLSLETEGQPIKAITTLLGLDIREVMAVLEPQLPREWHSGNEVDAHILRRARLFLTGWRRTALRAAAYWATEGCRPWLVQELTTLANAAERDHVRLNANLNPKYHLGGIEMLAADIARAALLLCPPIDLYLDMVVECAHNDALMQLPPGFFDDPAYHQGIAARRILDDQLGRVTLDEILANQKIVQDFERRWIDEKRRSMEATS